MAVSSAEIDNGALQWNQDEEEVNKMISDEIDEDEPPLFGYDASVVSEFWLHVDASESGAAARRLYEGLGYKSLPDDERRRGF
jgi:hypothetical protein